MRVLGRNLHAKNSIGVIWKKAFTSLFNLFAIFFWIFSKRANEKNTADNVFVLEGGVDKKDFFFFCYFAKKIERKKNIRDFQSTFCPNINEMEVLKVLLLRNRFKKSF